VIAGLVRDATGLRDATSPEDRRARLLAGVRARGVADPERVAAFLGELVDAPSSHPALAAARDDARLMGAQIRVAWVELVDAAVRDRPLVLVVEDLHWGDPPSIALLDAALAGCAGALLVLALARPEIDDLFPGLFLAHRPEVLRLDGISRRAAERLVNAVLERADADAVARLVTAAAGNPFYLEELIRAEADGAGVPGTVLAAVHSRLEALPPELRRVVRAAAVYGEAFVPDALAPLLGPLTDSGSSLAELVRREVIAPATASSGRDGEYRFRHALVRDAAYAMLLDDDRALGHRLAAAWLAEAGGADPLVVAGHLDLAGADVADRAPWWLRAAHDALAKNDFAGALDRAGRAAADPALAGEAFGVQAEAAVALGRNADVLAFGRQAMDRLTPGTIAWCRAACHTACWTSAIISDGPALEALTRRILDAETVSDEGGWIQAVCEAIGTLLFVGRIDAADRALAVLEGRAARLAPDAPAQAPIASVRGQRALYAGDYETACLAFDRAAATYEQRQELRSVLRNRSDSANARAMIGDFEAADRTFREVHALAVRLGVAAIIPAIGANLGMVAVARGDGAAGVELARRATAQLEASGNARFVVLARATGARARLLLGDPDAEAEARRAIGTLPDERFVAAHGRAALAEILAAGGRFAEALAVVDETLPDVPAGVELEDNLGPVLALARVDALFGLGRAEDAARIVADECARIRARADRIADPRLRACFTDGIRAHARLLALAT
jgi:tetratricopeptide (TPR) repeat protein